MQKLSRRTVRIAIGVLAAPLLALAVAGTAHAADIEPIGRYVDDTVSDTDAEIGGVADAVGFKAEDDEADDDSDSDDSED